MKVKVGKNALSKIYNLQITYKNVSTEAQRHAPLLRHDRQALVGCEQEH